MCTDCKVVHLKRTKESAILRDSMVQQRRELMALFQEQGVHSSGPGARIILGTDKLLRLRQDKEDRQGRHPQRLPAHWGQMPQQVRQCLQALFVFLRFRLGRHGQEKSGGKLLATGFTFAMQPKRGLNQLSGQGVHDRLFARHGKEEST
jgi:hypothetical protein